MNQYTCIYRKDHLDGFAAAWVIGKALGFDKVKFYPLRYNDPIPVSFYKRHIFIVGFSFCPRSVLSMTREARKVILFNTNEQTDNEWLEIEKLPPNLEYNYAPNKSNVMLAWEYFNVDEDPPALFAFIQDRELWSFELSCTREIIAYVDSKNYFHNQNFEDFTDLVEKPPNWHIQAGMVILDARQNFVNSLIQTNASEIDFANHRVLIANIPTLYASEAGNKLAENRAFAITYDDQLSRGVREFSLRSHKDYGIDVSEIARAFGGGGRRNAAGFSVPINAVEMFNKVKNAFR